MNTILNWLKDLGLRVGAALRASLYLFLIGIPIIVVALAAAAYGIWWRTLADGIRQNVVEFQSDQRLIGRDISWDRFDIAGFPFRIDATVLKPKYLAPDQGASWNIERLAMRINPFSVGDVGISFEGQQDFFYVKDGRWIETKTSAAQALVTVGAGLFGPETIGFDFKDLTGEAKIDALDFNFIVPLANGGIDVHAVESEGDLPRVEANVRFENVVLRGKDLVLPLGQQIALLDVAASAKFPTNLPQASAAIIVQEWKRSGTPVEIKRFELDWGGVTVSGKGYIKLDKDELPEGKLDLTVGNHARLMTLLRDYHWISEKTFAIAKPALDSFAFASGDKLRRIKVPLTFRDGEVYLSVIFVPVRVASMRPEPTPAQLAPPGVPADVVLPTTAPTADAVEAQPPVPPKPKRTRRRVKATLPPAAPAPIVQPPTSSPAPAPPQ